MSLPDDIPVDRYALEWQEEKERLWTPWVLGFLVVLATGLRFAWLGRPCLWWDEAATWGRLTGTYQELLNELQLDEFVPLYYQLLWALGRVLKWSEFTLRLVPAIAGVAMVPAMYGLARQLTNRRVALGVAALTSCSAWMLAFSRDAKMYMLFWLFAVLHVSALLMWLRRRTRRTWLWWIASGAIMLGLHLPGLFILALEPVFLLTYAPVRGRWVADRARLVLGFLLGAAVFSSGAAYHRVYFSRPQELLGHRPWAATTQSSEEEADLNIAGLRWIDRVNEGRSGPGMVAQTATSYLFGWEWPRESERAGIDRRVLKSERWAVWGLGCVLILGLLPWRRVVLKGRQRRPWEMTVAPDEAPRPPPPMPHASAQPVWRRTLWLAAWIVLPAYALYAASMPAFAGPVDWLRAGGEAMRAHWQWSLGIIAGLGIYAVAWVRQNHPVTWRALRERVWPAAQFLLALLIVLGLCFGVEAVFRRFELPPLWVPRYLGIVWPAVAIAAISLIARIGMKWIRLGALLMLLGANVAQAWYAVKMEPEPRNDLVARDVIASMQPRATVRTFLRITPLPAGPGTSHILSIVGKYYLSSFSGQVFAPHEIRRVPAMRLFAPMYRGVTERAAGLAVRANPFIGRIVIWDTLEEPIPTGGQALGETRGWTLLREDRYPAWNHWTWERTQTLRRREFERAGYVAPQAKPPARLPATRPAPVRRRP